MNIIPIGFDYDRNLFIVCMHLTVHWYTLYITIV